MIGHLIGSAFRGFFRIALVTLFFIALGVGVSLLVAYQVRSVWPPSTPAIHHRRSHRTAARLRGRADRAPARGHSWREDSRA